MWIIPACSGEPIQFWVLPSIPSPLHLYQLKINNVINASGQYVEHTFASAGSYDGIVSIIDSASGSSASTVRTPLVESMCDSVHSGEGVVFCDENDNGTQYPGESGYPNMLLYATPGPCFAITEADESFAISLPAGHWPSGTVHVILETPDARYTGTWFKP